ncbi:hypothetical protein SAMN06272789_6410 [Streptomyces sp. 1331.2]|nr:hypothetical protein SAMN06272789_6410 [Streptomyces sp. 1331.2]
MAVPLRRRAGPAWPWRSRPRRACRRRTAGRRCGSARWRPAGTPGPRTAGTRGGLDQVVLVLRVVGVGRGAEELLGVGGGRQVADRQLRLHELVGVHELQEGGRRLGVLALLQHRVEVVGVADHVGRVALAAGDAGEPAVPEGALGEVGVGVLLGGVLPGAHQLEGRLALGEQGRGAAVGELDRVEVRAERAGVDQLLEHAQGLLGVLALPGAFVAGQRLLEQLGARDAVEDVLVPHQGRPLVTTAEGERGDALGLEHPDGVEQVVPGLRDAQARVGQHLLVVEQQHGLGAAHRDAVGLAVDHRGVEHRGQEVALQPRVRGDHVVQREQQAGLHVGLDAAAAPVEEDVRRLRGVDDGVELGLVVRAGDGVQDGLDLRGLVEGLDQLLLDLVAGVPVDQHVDRAGVPAGGGPATAAGGHPHHGRGQTERTD